MARGEASSRMVRRGRRKPTEFERGIGMTLVPSKEVACADGARVLQAGHQKVHCGHPPPATATISDYGGGEGGSESHSKTTTDGRLHPIRQRKYPVKRSQGRGRAKLKPGIELTSTDCGVACCFCRAVLSENWVSRGRSPSSGSIHPLRRIAGRLSVLFVFARENRSRFCIHVDLCDPSFPRHLDVE